MKRVASIGECMIELRHRDAALLELSFAGDSFNTALYLARLNARDRLAVDYITALGDDPYSEAMLEAWRAEGVGTAAVARLPGKLPGLYLIRTGADGERRFFYYRSTAAARELFRAAETPILRRLREYDVLYFTAITLSILAPEARERFRAALAEARAAGRLVVFDSNYRPAGWPNAAAAQAAIAPFLDVVGMALPTFEDEQALWGDAEPRETLARYGARGVEVCVKAGAAGCHLGGGAHVPVPAPIAPVDTTAAGDAFNAAYLSARLAGAAAERAALAGHRLAGAVIQYPGAIIPRAAMPPIAL